MKEHFFEQMNKLKGRVRLSPERKASIREELSGFMASYEGGGVSDENVARLLSQSNNTFRIKNLLRPMPIFAVITIFATMAGGGITYAAQAALPGEALYPVKILSENVATDLTFSTKGKAELGAQHAERRLEEASVLTAQGKMNATTSAVVAEHFDQNTDETNKNIASLRKSGDVASAADITSGFEATLRAHQKIIARFGAGSSTLAVALEGIKERVDERLQETERLSSDLDNEVTTSSTAPMVMSAANGRVGAAENAIEEVRNYLGEKKAGMSAEGAAEAEARLSRAENDLASAKADIQTGAFGDAFDTADRAFQEAKEVRLIAKTQILLRLKMTVEGNEKEGSPQRETSDMATSSSPEIKKEQKEEHDSSIFPVMEGRKERTTGTTTTSSEDDQEAGAVQKEEKGNEESVSPGLEMQLKGRSSENEGQGTSTDENGGLRFKFEF